MRRIREPRRMNGPAAGILGLTLAIAAALTGVALTVAMTGCSNPPPKRVFIDPGLAPLIPPDTTVLAGVRVDLLAKHPAFGMLARQHAIQRFVEITGIDPEKSLWQVL